MFPKPLTWCESVYKFYFLCGSWQRLFLGFVVEGLRSVVLRRIVFNFFLMFIFERERERERMHKQGRGREREGDKDSEASSRL